MVRLVILDTAQSGRAEEITLYRVQIGYGKRAYETHGSFINKEQALRLYNNVEVVHGGKKRLLENNTVIARKISHGRFFDV